MLRRLLDRFWAWAATRRDDLVSDDRLAACPPGPIDRDLAQLLRESSE